MKIGDWYVYCDICGRRCLASETVELTQYTGKGGLIVCKYDADSIDPGLIPFRTPVERSIPRSRVAHTDTTDGSPTVDLETMTYQYYLASSQDNIILTPSQNMQEQLVVNEPI